MKKQLLFTCSLLIFLAGAIRAQVTVNGGPTLTYTSLNTAFAAINAGTHFGAITIDITGNTIEGVTGYAPTPLLASGQSFANYTSIIIRPTVQATVSGSPATGRGVIELDGADNVTIDGDIVAGPVQRDLTFQHSGANTLAATAVIRLLGKTTGGLGATNNIIQNNILIGNTVGNDGASGSTVVNSYGIYMGVNAVALTTGGTGDNYDNNIISNNEIQKAYFGIWIGGTANTADNNTIIGNLIGSNTVGQTITYIGINLTGVATNTITQNEIFNLKLNTSVNNAGIQLAGTGAANTISRNKIWGIHSLSTSGYGAYGINLTGGNNHVVVNNAIYDIKTINYSSTTTTWNAFGIRITSGTGIKVYYNSVNLFGQITVSAAFTSVGSAAFLVTSTAVTGLEVKNNIFNNSQFSTDATATIRKFMAVWFPASYNFLNAVLDNNAYNVTNSVDHIVGKVGTTNNVTEGINITGWKALSQVNNATNDVNSVPVFNFAAPFTSNTNLTIPINTVYGAESGGVIIASLGTNIDINGNVRPLAGTNPNTDPDMGAYEFDGLNGTPIDAGINTLVSPAAGGCYSATESVIARIKNYGTSAAANIPVTVIVSGALSQTLNGTYAGSIPANGTFDFTLSPTINMSAVGVYNFKSYTSLAGDSQLLNDTLSNITRTVFPVMAIPQAVNFTGFTGANLTTFFPDWYEAVGATNPGGTTSAWTSQTNLNSPGNITARLNMFTNTRNEWIVGPKILATVNTNISFDAAVTNFGSTTVGDVMGSDDKVRVMVSTDCGLTYSPVFTVSATNNLGITFTNFNVNLGSYAGQNIIVAFLAQDGPVDDIEDYDFHLDNINLFNASPTDAGVSAVVSPSTGCFTAAEPVVVNVTNFGTAAIANFPVTVWVSGAATQTLTGMYVPSLAPSASANFTVGTLNMAAAGSYTLKGFTSLPGDLNNNNDTSVVIKTTLPLATLPQFVNFTGFTGANLPTFFPDWREAQGAAVPSGTTSSWTSQTNLNSTGNVNARIFLSATAANDWIVGPKILATASSTLSFDAALTANTTAPFTPSVMGSDDKVRVLVSTDCGVSFTPIFTINATNNLGISFTNFNVNLGAYNGQEIIVAFQAQDGPIDDPGSYYFHLENINLYNVSATDAGVTSIVTPSVGCFTNAEPVVVNVQNFGSATISNFPVSAIISGAVTQTLTSTFTGNLAAFASANFTVGTLNMSTAGTYSIKGHTSLSGDTNIFNDSTMVVKNSIAVATLPQSVNFTGFTGANLNTLFPNWNEGNGIPAPTATTSNWTSQNGLNGGTNVNARIFLSAAANNVWVVGPRFTATANSNISFDAAVTGNTGAPFTPSVMGSDDMMRVMVSTDCGNTYAPIYTVSATNNLGTNFSNFIVNLSAYNGQDIIVAFLAQDGPIDDIESYYLHLDNINLYNAAAADGGVSAILSPTINACLSATEQIVVTVNNYGFNALTNFPVTAVISGPINSTVTSNYPGTLAPSTSASYTIGTANMNVSGTYTINAFTGVSGDPNAFNDATVMTTIQTPNFGIAGNNVICGSGSATLNVTGSATSYTWETSAITSSIVVSPSVTTTYSALGTGTNNCQVSSFFTVTVSNPTITGLGAAVCGTNVVGTLTANAFAPVSWYSSPTSTVVLATGNTFTATAATTTTFYAEAASSSNASLQTTFADNNGCGAGTMFDITATNGAIVIDSLDVNSSVAASSTFSIFLYYKSGTYVGSETNPAAWTAWDTVVVTSAGTGNPSRVVPLTLNLPNNQLYGIYASYAARYTNTTTTYSNADLTVQAGSGFCTAFSGPIAGRAFNGNIYYSKPGCISPKVPVTLTVNPQPVVSINPAPSNVICAGNTVTLTASGADTYTWNTSATSTVITATPFTSTTYTVDGSSVNCPGSFTASMLVTVNANPTVNITPGTASICAGNSITLNASGAVIYNWNTSATTQSIVGSPTVNTTYSVIGTAANSCTSSALVNITVNAKPTVSISAASNTACLNGGPVSLTGSPAGGVFSGPNVSGGVLNPSATGTFNPVYTFTNSTTGCSNSATASIVVSICTDIISQTAQSASLKVYPNPNYGTFTIETGNSIRKTIELTDLTGRIVYKETTDNETINMNITELANGIYHVRISSDNGIDIIKVVKQ